MLEKKKENNYESAPFSKIVGLLTTTLLKINSF